MKNVTSILLLFHICAIAQLKPVFISESKSKLDWFAGIDNIGWQYSVKDNVLFKEKDGRRLQYQNISLGKINNVDILNPMNIAIFYEDFNSVVMVDNQLNEIRRINFSDYTTEPLVVHAIGNASQNRLWIYNNLTQQLGLFDYLKNTFVAITQQLKGNIVHYETDFNHFYWVDEQHNRFTCDLFGKIASRGKLPDFDKIQFVDDHSALYAKDAQLYYFSLDGNTTPIVDLGKNSATGFWYGAQNLAIFTPDGISIYNLKLR